MSTLLENWCNLLKPMDNSKMEQILVDWSFWDKPVPPSIPRSALTPSLPLKPDLVLAIQGVRRCGKSTLLTQIMRGQGLDPMRCYFLNFEDPRLSQDLNPKLLDSVLAYARDRSRGEISVFFFDEIQEVDEWEKWLHVKVERPGKEVFVITGSNASLLSGDLTSRLTGRYLTLELFPFDFEEFRISKPTESFESYLDLGGFPRALSFETPQKLLREYFDQIIEKDVRRHVAVRSTLTLIQLAKAVFESAGSEMSQRRLSQMIDVSADTLGTYIHAAQAAYLIYECPFFTFSEKQRAARNRKFYPVDLGMRKAVITQGGRDRGKDLETVVFHHLRKQHKQVFYWKGTSEVDFVIQGSEGIVPHQVSWDGPKPRHMQAISEFKKTYPQALDGVFIDRKNIESWLKTRG
jgi:predicted AAA+ superfamily ATPase